MSGYVSPEGVRIVIKLITDLGQATAELDGLGPKVASMQQRLADLRETRRTLESDLRKAMMEMDAESPGNYGWSARIAAFATEMKRQLEEQIRAERQGGGPA